MRSYRWLIALGALALAVAAMVILSASPDDSGGRRRESATSEERSPRAPPRLALDEGCEHPLFPERTGATRTYVATADDAQYELIFTLDRITRSRREVRATWSVEMRIEGAEPVTLEVERRCDTTGAEEPWFGFGLGALVRLEAQTWRWPHVLEPGQSFAGTVRLRTLAFDPIEVRRRYRIIDEERVEVPAGTFRATRVDSVDIASGSAEATPGSYWVAAGVGLVRSTQSLGPGQDLELELSAAVDP